MPATKSLRPRWHFSFFVFRFSLFILIVLQSYSPNVFSQQQPADYQLFRQDATYYYHQVNSATYPYVVAAKLDSSIVTADGTEWFNHDAIFRYFYDEYDWCFRPDGPSWIGMKLLVKPDGDNLLYGLTLETGWPYHVADTIIIKTRAMPDDSWRYFQTEVWGGWDTLATITRHDTMSFLGITDSVKVIDFGIDSIILSKSHGLVRALNFRDYFPFQNTNYDSYELVGITTPDTSVGKGLLTYGDIWDYEIGDIFHRGSESNAYLNGTMYEIFEVLDKYYSSGLDTVVYIMSRVSWHVGPEGTSEVEYDTVVEHYTDLNSLIAGGHLPTETIWDEEGTFYEMAMYFKETLYHGRSFFEFPYMVFYPFPSPDTCYGPIWSSYTSYIEGLGSYLYIFNDEYYCSLCQFIDYYQKGDEEWGTPYEIPLEIKELLQLPVKIYPVPAGDYVIIEINEKDFDDYATIRLYDLSGRILLEESVLTSRVPYRMELGTLYKGIYYLRIISGNGIFTGKIVH